MSESSASSVVRRSFSSSSSISTSSQAVSPNPIASAAPANASSAVVDCVHTDNRNGVSGSRADNTLGQGKQRGQEKRQKQCRRYQQGADRESSSSTGVEYNVSARSSEHQPIVENAEATTYISTIRKALTEVGEARRLQSKSSTGMRFRK